ncbi:uncharacterized protein BO95DRAFT_40038 [Aspergillus brunneoviolaceus CBS 621.78]|uniref:Uncharacterized protein n=1 Tax=Aspergillus brunneoviolaceus CBS 621.78 TaxID=1450534 RepID=A0ACD1FS49_9EURO|nr:hypothetical protein BO95DRAFT_40038 [Aspergillus brunneoviolaceus CBS 621.78]RAH39815.1 hypothetical protein BO95DRAFT_40038 [Aspergillus brunneoviolaceus CBS 621.78]
MVAESLDSEKAINSLTRINRFFYSLLNPFLYRYHARNDVELSALQHAARRDLPGVIEHLVDAGVSLHSREAWFGYSFYRRSKYDHPIVLAANSSHANVMETLLDKEELTSGLTERHFSDIPEER